MVLETDSGALCMLSLHFTTRFHPVPYTYIHTHIHTHINMSKKEESNSFYSVLLSQDNIYLTRSISSKRS